MHRRRLLIALVCCFVAVLAVLLVAARESVIPMDARLVNCVPHGADKELTAEIQCHNRSVLCTDSLRIQLHIAGRWEEPQDLPEYEQTFFPIGMNVQRVDLSVPARADACRFLLGYRTRRMTGCRAYSLMNRYGLGRLPGLWRNKLANIMSQPSGLHQAQCELTLPPDTHDKLAAAAD
jgi:hypothetical protein